MPILDKIFGNPNEKALKKIQPIIDKTNELEKKVEKLSNAKIKSRYQEIKKDVEEKIKKQENKFDDNESERKITLDTLEPYIPEVFALTREAAKRTLGQRHYDVQLIGGYVLHQGRIAEMKTGEGKTLSSTLAASLNALTGKGVHIVTVNDYLARRDCGWMGQVYDFLGLSTATIIHSESYLFDSESHSEDSLDEKTEPLRLVQRKAAYAADITYGTNNEFGFDYLRDNMAQTFEQMVQRPLNFAVVDEVDSILIDEARTPLIISGPAEAAGEKYYEFARMVKNLNKETDYIVDEKGKTASLTDEGIAAMEKIIGVDNIYEEVGIENVHHIEQALKAHALFKKDKDYIVKNGEILIIDEFTGRMMEGRRYSGGLHQAIEAKEGVEIKRENITLATISFQNYFRLYTKLSGMTGTAETEAEEFHKIYELEVTVIPTNKELIRNDMPDVIYKTEVAKFNAVVKDIKEKYEKGQPVLVGTVSIEKNEILSDLLKREGIKHEVLNAKNHEKEALIIENAGQKSAVTVATNMAGRGTDILLTDEVKKAGGLHVIGTERHESRRIDNQLRGRAGRQGDTGSSQFFVSLEDDLMRIFGSDRVGTMMAKLGLPDDTPIQHSLITKSLEQAQKKVESRNFDIRKHLVEYDDVMNRQREYVYSKRREIMKSEELKGEIQDFLSEEAEKIVNSTINIQTDKIDNEKLLAVTKGALEISKQDEKELKEAKQQNATKIIKKVFKDGYERKIKEIGEKDIKILERTLYMRIIDTLWVNHLDALTHLREGVGLRGYGQKDPLVEYKNEAYKMFQTLLSAIQTEFVSVFFKSSISKAPQAQERKKVENLNQDNGNISKPQKELEKNRKVGRNDPCPCGSGKKYKKCHGN